MCHYRNAVNYDLLQEWTFTDNAELIKSKLCHQIELKQSCEALGLILLDLQALRLINEQSHYEQHETATLEDLEDMINDADILQNSEILLDALIGSFYEALDPSDVSKDAVAYLFKSARLPEKLLATDELSSYFKARFCGQNHHDAKEIATSQHLPQDIRIVELTVEKSSEQMQSMNGDIEDFGKPASLIQDTQEAFQCLHVED